MSSAYKTWICSSKQRLKTKTESNSAESGDEISISMTEESEINTEDEDSAKLSEWALAPILMGFNVVQVFCCQDMVNLLTDTGDVYCSLFSDLESHQTEVLYGQNI